MSEQAIAFKELRLGFGGGLIARRRRGQISGRRRLEMWQELKPGFFLGGRLAARLKSGPVTVLASMESLRQFEAFVCY